MLSPTAWKILEGFCTGALRNFVCYVHRTAQQLCLLSAPEPSGTSWAICTGTLRTWSAIRNPPASHPPSTPEPPRTSSVFCPEPSTPEPFGTLSEICTRTLRNFISFLPRNPPEPHQPSAPEPSEPHQQSAPEGSGTFRNLLRNLVLQLHRIAPEFFWAKDPIASFAVGEKTTLYRSMRYRWKMQKRSGGQIRRLRCEVTCDLETPQTAPEAIDRSNLLFYPWQGVSCGFWRGIQEKHSDACKIYFSNCSTKNEVPKLFLIWIITPAIASQQLGVKKAHPNTSLQTRQHSPPVFAHLFEFFHGQGLQLGIRKSARPAAPPASHRGQKHGSCQASKEWASELRPCQTMTTKTKRFWLHRPNHGHQK